MGADTVRRIADAVLYEGYLLWPYRKSALKNQQRFTFGGVYPPAWDDSSCLQVQALLQAGGEADVEVQVRFLQMVERQVLKSGCSGAVAEPVEELEVDGQRWMSWEEAVERKAGLGALQIDAGEELEEIPGGAIRRSWRALEGEVSLTHELLRRGLWRITVCVFNTSSWSPSLHEVAAPLRPGGDAHASRRRATRERALRHTFCSTHAVLHTRSGAWVSLTDPPGDVQGDAEACENIGVWPVLVGEEADTSTMLASPIILSDHPQIAPESPGDLFDSGEIDQMLVLNILAMTERERREMRDSDPRAREILERTEALTDAEIMRLHGVVRELGLVRSR